MLLDDVGPALTGDKLVASMLGAKEQRKAIAEGLLYEHTVVMTSAGPGVGKSTIATQMAMELSAGASVFGAHIVPRPMRVLYCQTERPILEFLERAERLSKIIKVNKDNLIITDEYKIFNLLKEDHVIMLIKAINRDCPNVDVIFMDPIYPLVSGGLSADAPASAFCKAMSLVQKHTGAAMWYTHHTSKVQHDSYGSPIVKDDPFYGSQWLKAHVTGSFLMNMAEDGSGVKLICKKDNYNVLSKLINLEYDPESGLSVETAGDVTVTVRVTNFLDIRARDGKTFTFKDMQTFTQATDRPLRKVLSDSNIGGRLVVVGSHRNKKTYKALPASTNSTVPTPP